MSSLSNSFLKYAQTVIAEHDKQGGGLLVTPWLTKDSEGAKRYNKGVK